MQTKDVTIRQVKDFSIKDALLYGFKKTNEHILLILSIELVFFCAWFVLALAESTIDGIPDKIVDPNFLQELTSALGALIHHVIPLAMKGKVFFVVHMLSLSIIFGGFVLMQGVRRIMVDIYEKNESSLSGIYSQFGVFSVILLAKILYLVAVLCGSICLILPGIYLSAKYGFYAYCLLDDQTLGPVEALKKSGQLTKGYVNHLCVYNILWIILLLLSIFLWVAWIIIVPVLMLADAYIYRQMTQNETEVS